jgi:hypothetical protein
MRTDGHFVDYPMPIEGAQIPISTLCGHPKQGVPGEQNQSVATCVEVGFLGNPLPP